MVESAFSSVHKLCLQRQVRFMEIFIQHFEIECRTTTFDHITTRRSSKPGEDRKRERTHVVMQY